MTREKHLKFCKTCTNRKLNMKEGLVCNITGEKADFEKECPSFELDNSVVETMDDREAIEHNEVLHKLSDKNIAKFEAEQDYPKAIITGSIVGILGALLWSVITVSTGVQIGYLAIAIGAVVGLSMRVIGKGINQIFGISGGIIALLSCLLGNFFSIIGFVANAQELGYWETLNLFDYSQVVSIMTEIFNPIDLLFYGIAAYEGYKFSFRTFTEKDIYELEK
jgi:hypothetical protein